MPIVADFSDLANQLPVVLSREEASKRFSGLVSPEYLRQLDRQGEGPQRYRAGRKVFYKTTDFLAWLSARAKPLA